MAIQMMFDTALVHVGVPTKATISVNNSPSLGGSTTLTCRSSSTTTPSNHSLSLTYSWKVDNVENPTDSRYSYSTNKNRLTLSNLMKADARKQFTCLATEVVSDGYNSSRSDSFSLDVRYPPDGPPVITNYTDGGEYRIIEGTQGQLSCSVSGGNPTPTLTWDCINNVTSQTTSAGTVTKTHSWLATRGQDKTCTCRASYYSGDLSVSIRIKIFYPPGKPTFRIRSITVSGTVRVIKHNSLSVTCSSEGQPAPSYTWTFQNGATSNNAQLTVSSVQTNGIYTCDVRNTMNPSVGSTVSGSNSSLIDVLLLYPPVIGDLKNISIVEGSSSTVSCPVTVGNPPETTFEWRRNGSGQVWKRVQEFTLGTTSRTDAMFYTCTVSNRMIQTGNQPISQPDTKSFYLNVWYRTSVAAFYFEGYTGQTNLSVREHHKDVHFVCEVDGNPVSTVKFVFGGKVLKEVLNDKYISFTRSNIACLDGGVYTCEVRNNYGPPSRREITLLVICPPRPLHQIQQNVSSFLHVPVTLTFTALAYPSPGPEGFTWQKQNGIYWTPLLSNVDLHILSSALQSNLTIQNVSYADFGHYRVNVSNSIGSYIQYLFLTKEVRLQTSTEKEETYTDSSPNSDRNSNTPMIIGISLGIVCVVLVIYAVSVSFLYKRKTTRKGNHGRLGTQSPEQATEQRTYVNLAFKSDITENQQLQDEAGANTCSTDDTDAHSEEPVTQYTSLDQYSRDDRTVYDLLQGK